MRTLTPEKLTEYATEYGLPADIAQRDYVAIRVAHAIASDKGVGDQIALKGGFVLRYGYGSHRTSKDIDGTIGTKHDAVDPKRLQRVVRNQCADLSVKFDPKNATVGVDSLDFGNIEYVGPLTRGFLTIEMSYREDLVVEARKLKIDSFGVGPFLVRALAIDEMIAEKWRCLVQRSPRRPGDLYDLWYLWSDFKNRPPHDADDTITDAEVQRIVPMKIDCPGGKDAVVAALDAYRGRWVADIGDALPSDAPAFDIARSAVMEAARAWTPWR